MDWLLIMACTILGFVLALFAYRQHPLPYDEILSIWAFGVGMDIVIFLWGLWNGYWDLVAPVFGRFGTVLVTWIIASPGYYVAFVCLLRKSWDWNMALTVAFAVLKTGLECIAVYVVAIGNYGNGWHLSLTFCSYLLSLLVMWGYYKFLLFLKRLAK